MSIGHGTEIGNYDVSVGIVADFTWDICISQAMWGALMGLLEPGFNSAVGKMRESSDSCLTARDPQKAERNDGLSDICS